MRYLPATEGANVGGDWYDAFPLDGNRVGLVIGDVTGHSIASASIMGQVRSMLRAYAIDYPDPGEVLARTNTALMLSCCPKRSPPPCTPFSTRPPASWSTPTPGTCPRSSPRGARQVDYLDKAVGRMLGASPARRSPPRNRRLPAGSVLLTTPTG
mgnify:CR=1 FL=1